jgi:hypothetical protein
MTFYNRMMIAVISGRRRRVSPCPQDPHPSGRRADPGCVTVAGVFVFTARPPTPGRGLFPSGDRLLRPHLRRRSHRCQASRIATGNGSDEQMFGEK